MKKTKLLLLIAASLSLVAVNKPAEAVVVANFDFDPDELSGTQADVDGSSQANWTTSILLDNATGDGAVNAPNQSLTNRDLFPGNTGDFLRLSSNRERAVDSNGPNGTVGESTWFTFDITPSPLSVFDFTGQNATVDTYAFNGIGGTSATNWTLYFSLDDGVTYKSLGTFAGQTAGPNTLVEGPKVLTWDLTQIGTQTGAIDFLIDPVSTADINGVANQRATGFDNLVVNASVEPIPFEAEGTMGLVALGSYLFYRKKRQQKAN